MTLNGDVVAVPMHKSYKDGSQIRLEDKGITFSSLKNIPIRTLLGGDVKGKRFAN